MLVGVSKRSRSSSGPGASHCGVTSPHVAASSSLLLGVVSGCSVEHPATVATKAKSAGAAAIAIDLFVIFCSFIRSGALEAGVPLDVDRRRDGRCALLSLFGRSVRWIRPKQLVGVG